MRKAETARKGQSPSIPPAMIGPAVVLVLASIGYLAWFLQAAPPRYDGQPPVRIALLGELRDPFGLIAQWFGPAGTPLGLLDRMPVLAMAGLILLAGYGIGQLAIDRLRLAEGCSPLERSVFALAGGLSLLSTGMLLGGLVGGLGQSWLLWLMVVGLALAGGWGIYHNTFAKSATEAVSSSTEHPSAIRTPHLAWLGVPFAMILVFGACLPPWDFDVREYHLQVPKEWLQQGRITFLPHNVYGNMPLAAEMHALMAMALWPGEHGWFYGGLAGKLVVAAFAMMAAAAVAAAAYRMAGKPAAVVAGLAVISHPWMVHVSVSGLNDGMLACYIFLSLYAMWLARRGHCSYLLAGLFAGAAAATKYPGLAFAVAPIAVWGLIPAGWTFNPPEAHSFQGRPIVVVALLVAGLVLGGGAWYAKNAVMADNPVYPLAYGVFGGATRTPEKAAQWDRAHQVPGDEHGRRYTPKQLAASALRVAGRDELASPLVLPLLAAAGIAAVLLLGIENPQSASRNPHSMWPFALALVWTLAVWWLLSHRLDRFLLPAWPLTALLAAAALRIDEHWWRRAITAVVVVGALYSLLAASSQLVGDNRWFVSLAQLRRDGPWPEGTALRIKPGHQLLNERAQPSEAVLLVGDAQPLDLEMPVFYSTCFDDCLLCDWMLGRTPDERRAELAQRNITWVLVDWPEIARYQSPGNYGFDSRFEERLVDELLEQGILGPPQMVSPFAPSQRREVEVYPVQPVSPP